MQFPGIDLEKIDISSPITERKQRLNTGYNSPALSLDREMSGFENQVGNHINNRTTSCQSDTRKKQIRRIPNESAIIFSSMKCCHFNRCHKQSKLNAADRVGTNLLKC